MSTPTLETPVSTELFSTQFELHDDQVNTASLASTKDGHAASILHNTPLYVAESSKGKHKYWQGFVVAESLDGMEVTVYTRTVSFQETSSGVSKPIVSTPKLVKGKNLGKSNETSPVEQALFNIGSDARKKEDKGYYVYGTEVPEKLPLPMLAHPFDKRGHNITWPCFAQPKLDGFRMLFDGVKGWSRKGKLYIDEVIAHLKTDLPDDVILDGELMLDPRAYTFQETTRTIKKYRGDEHPKLDFHVYDLILKNRLDASFQDRLDILRKLAVSVFADVLNIRIVPTQRVGSKQQAQIKHDFYVSQGLEGLMLRNAAGVYKQGHRSVNLQKVKVFDDAEFPIVDFTEGQGKDAGTVVFTCATSYGDQFQVRPRGTVEQRQAWFKHGDKLIGQPLTVRYFGVSEEGIPRFPVGVGVRPDWDA